MNKDRGQQNCNGRAASQNMNSQPTPPTQAAILHGVCFAALSHVQPSSGVLNPWSQSLVSYLPLLVAFWSLRLISKWACDSYTATAQLPWLPDCKVCSQRNWQASAELQPKYLVLVYKDLNLVFSRGKAEGSQTCWRFTEFVRSDISQIRQISLIWHFLLGS